MHFGHMKKCCCFPLATACVIMSIFYVIGTVLSLFSNQNEAKYVVFILNLAITLILILGLVLKNWVMFAILSVLCACNFFFGVVILIVLIIGIFLGGSGGLLVFIIGIITMSLFIAISLFSLDICYSMCKIIQAGGTGWEGKSVDEIEAEKESAASKLEKGPPKEEEETEEHNVQ